jgi:hypothetical protein
MFIDFLKIFPARHRAPHRGHPLPQLGHHRLCEQAGGTCQRAAGRLGRISDGEHLKARQAKCFKLKFKI